MTGVYPSTPLYPLLYEAELTLTLIFLDYCQKLYVYRLFCFSNQYPAKEFLPVSLKNRDGGCQPEKLPESTLIWIQNA